MQRVITYRGFEIHVELTPAAEDTFNVTVQIKGGTNLEVLGAAGGGRSRCATALLLNDGPTWLGKSPVKPQSTCCLARLADSIPVSPPRYTHSSRRVRSLAAFDVARTTVVAVESIGVRPNLSPGDGVHFISTDDRAAQAR